MGPAIHCSLLSGWLVFQVDQSLLVMWRYKPVNVNHSPETSLTKLVARDVIQQCETLDDEGRTGEVDPLFYK